MLHFNQQWLNVCFAEIVQRTATLALILQQTGMLLL